MLKLEFSNCFRGDANPGVATKSYYATIEEIDGAMGNLRVMLVVGNHDDCSSILVEFSEQAHYFQTVLRVEVTRRLIGKNQLRIEDHGTGNGHSLLLTAGELMREVLGSMSYRHAFHSFLNSLFALYLVM